MSVTRSRPSASRPERPRTAVPSGPASEAPRKYFWQALGDQFRPEPQVYQRLVWTLAAVMVAFSVAPVGEQRSGVAEQGLRPLVRDRPEVLARRRHLPDRPPPLPVHVPPRRRGPDGGRQPARGSHGFVWLLLALQSAAWVGSILLAVRLATGKALRQHPLLYLVPTLWVVPFVHDMYLLGQPNLLLLCLDARRVRLPAGRPAVVGGGPGRAWRRGSRRSRSWRWGIWSTGGSGRRPPRRSSPWPPCSWSCRCPSGARPRPWDDLVVWTKGMVLKYDEGQIAQRPERCYSFKNQSLDRRGQPPAPRRPRRRRGERPLAGERGEPRLQDRQQGRRRRSGLGLCLFYVASMPWRTPRADGRRVFAAETAMLLLMVLVFSPFAFNYFYVWLIYPLTVLLSRLLDAPAGSPREARARRRPGRRAGGLRRDGLLAPGRPGVREPARRRPRAAGAAGLAARARPVGPESSRESIA